MIIKLLAASFLALLGVAMLVEHYLPVMVKNFMENLSRA